MRDSADLTRQVVAERFFVQELIAKTGLSEVYRAWDIKTTVDVVLKRITAWDSDEAWARAQTEVELMSLVGAKTDRVPELLTGVVDDEHGNPCFVMEHCGEKTLEQELREKPRGLRLRDLRRLGTETAAGLIAAHSVGVFHRDNKPLNITQAERGYVLIDWAGRRDGVDGHTALGGVVRTPGWDEPQQRAGKPVDEATDQYIWGLVLRAACGLEPPADGNDPAVNAGRQHAHPPSPRARRLDLPRSVRGVLQHATEERREDRYASMAEALTAWRAAFAGLTAAQLAADPAVAARGDEARDVSRRGRATAFDPRSWTAFRQSSKRSDPRSSALGQMGRRHVDAYLAKMAYVKHAAYRPLAVVGDRYWGKSFGPPEYAVAAGLYLLFVAFAGFVYVRAAGQLIRDGFDIVLSLVGFVVHLLAWLAAPYVEDAEVHAGLQDLQTSLGEPWTRLMMFLVALGLLRVGWSRKIKVTLLSLLLLGLMAGTLPH